jgi:hypothetical protein
MDYMSEGELLWAAYATDGKSRHGKLIRPPVAPPRRSGRDRS